MTKSNKKQEFNNEVIKRTKDALEKEQGLLTMISLGDGEVSVIGGNISKIGVIELLINTLAVEVDGDELLTEVVKDATDQMLQEVGSKHEG